MIRRFVGKDFWLFTQAEHARVASELARVVGNAKLVGPSKREGLVEALALHEIGWAESDASPLLSAQRFPLDALEAHWTLSLAAWTTVTREAVAKSLDPYTTLLLSIHGLQQSHDVGKITERASRFDPQEMRKAFEANKFQHREIELQEQIRPGLGLAIDQPRRLGLAVDLLSGPERILSNDYRWMQACDLMSLSLLGTDVIAMPLGPIFTPTGSTETLRLKRIDAGTMIVAPWPFEVGSIRLTAAYRPYPALPTRSLPEFQHALAAVAPRTLEMVVKPA